MLRVSATSFSPNAFCSSPFIWLNFLLTGDSMIAINWRSSSSVNFSSSKVPMVVGAILTALSRKSGTTSSAYFFRSA